MKLKLVPFWISLLFAIDGFGQSKSVSVPVYKSGDTTGYYGIQRERIAQMKMRDPLVSKDSCLIRVSCENWSVEVSSADLKTFEGRQYFFTKQYLSSDARWSRELFKTKSISKSQARAVYEAFLVRSIASIPDEEDIPRWPWGADGVRYLIEYSTPSTYSLKTYWEPSSARYEIVAAAAIDDFIREIKAKLGLSKSFLVFLNKLPPGTYHTGGITAYNNAGKKRKAAK